MPTTALLVEIIIVGFSFFLCVLPIGVVLFHINPDEILLFYTGISLQFQLAAAYTAGIIWNRTCDQIFHKINERLIRTKFPSREDYQQARIRVIFENQSIRDYLGSMRSFIRVSRACSVLFLVYIVPTPIYLFRSPQAISLSILTKIAIIVFELVLLVISTYAWFRLERGYIAAIHDALTALNLKESRANK